MRPAMRMRSESTPAKIGRSMKNLERFISAFGRGELRHRYGLGEDGRTGSHPLQAVHDDAFVRLEARSHDAKPIDRLPERHLAIGSLVVRAHHEHELLALVGAAG